MVKMGTIVLMILAITLVFTMYGSVINDMEQSYPEVYINSSTWEGQYDYREDITTRAENIKESFANINQESNWLAIVDTTVALPSAIYNSIGLVIASIGFGTTAMTGIMNNMLGIPPTVTLIIISGFVVVVVFSIVSFWRRSPA